MMEWPGPESFVPYYDPEGNAAWEYKVGTGWETFNLFFSGKHAAVNNTTEGLRWRHLDHLGNLVLKTNNVGSDVCRYYYKPYGELNYRTCTEADDYWFTGKERDAETGLDYFGARYHGSAIGRFTSSDPSRESADPANPQSWNRYAYTLNNPLRHIDPDGESPIDVIQGFANGLTSSVALNLGRVDARTRNRDFRIGQAAGDVAATAMGIAGLLVATGGVGGGSAISATGVGALVGVPAVAASAALGAHGVSAATLGAANATEGMLNLTFKKGESGSSAGDVKALSDSSLKGIDVHAAKKSIVGEESIRKYNIGTDKKGNVYLIAARKGERKVLRTEYTFAELKQPFPGE